MGVRGVSLLEEVIGSERMSGRIMVVVVMSLEMEFNEYV